MVMIHNRLSQVFTTTLLLVLALFTFAACGGSDSNSEVEPTAQPTEIRFPTATSVPLPTKEPTATPEPHPVTIDGWDPDSGTIIDPVRLWKNYTDRDLGVAGEVRHGETVNMIKRQGNGVLVVTSDGTQGWLTYLFIEELR